LRRALRAACLAACLALLAAPAAHGSPGPGAVGKVSHGNRDRAERTASFWTAERIRRARPAEPRPHAAPDRVRGSAPASSNEFEVTDTTTYPASTNGLVLFKLRHDLFECSGTAIDSENQRVVITAGHCVYSGGKHGRWAKKWIFIPGYSHGLVPFGRFTGNELWATKKWVRKKNFSFDIGAVVMSRNAAGQKVAEAAGGRSIAFNQPRIQTFQAFGYPAAGGFDGQSLVECDAPYAGDDPFSDPGPPALSVDCRLPGGASGGGWIIGGRYLNSLTSYGYADPNVTYGPYFGNAAMKLFDKVRG
jgi:V8-like Glu-specific endopeptidase